MNALSSCTDAPGLVTFHLAGEEVVTSAGREASETFKAEIEYLHPFVMRVGELLRMRSIDYGVFQEGGSWVGFRFKGDGDGDAEVVEAKGLVSTTPASLGAILHSLEDR